jgi:PIN domain nuclease of toxin-antitoxin system
VIHLDTHVVVWLYAGQVERLSSVARDLLESQPPRVSPAAVLELQYLHEIGRLTPRPSAVLAELERTLGIGIVDASFADLVREAGALSWTRDPFDRVIAAHAVLEKAPLLTADATIRANLESAVWD